MLVKFRETRKKLEALQQANTEDYARSNLTFHQSLGMFKKKLPPDVPGLSCESIQTLEVKHVKTGHKLVNTDTGWSNRKARRRSSSVVKRISVLVSNVRAAKYVLVLLTTLIFTWGPCFGYALYESISHMVDNDMDPNRSDVNITQVLTFLNTAIQSTQFNFTIETENYNQLEIKERIRNVFHIKEAEVIDMLAYHFALFNSMANPIIYAFWYSDFRNYIVKIPHWFVWKQKKINSQISPFEI